MVGWKVPGMTGMELQGRLSYEGRRSIIPDASVQLPAWTRLDAALRYDTKIGGTATSWTVGIDNLLDKRYWKESPYQFGHIYLYPGAARTLRLAFTATL